jgi:serine/threonine protein kinase
MEDQIADPLYIYSIESQIWSDCIIFSGEIKLCDFGESRMLENSLATTHVGTIAYWPPEHFTKRNSKYDNRSDVWSLGITLMEIILGQLPYLKLNDSPNLHDENFVQSYALQQLIESTNFLVIIENCIRTKGYSPELCDLLKKCTEKLELRLKLKQLTETMIYKEYRNVDAEDISKIISMFIRTNRKSQTVRSPKGLR